LYTPNHHATHAHLSGFAYAELLIELVRTLFCQHTTAAKVMHSIVYVFYDRELDSNSEYVTSAQDISPGDSFTGGGSWEVP